MKVVLGAGLWNLPHIVILDEPTNFLDRDSLGALATAIKAFQGTKMMIMMIIVLHDIPHLLSSINTSIHLCIIYTHTHIHDDFYYFLTSFLLSPFMLQLILLCYPGGLFMISHNAEFYEALCPEKWILESGRLTVMGAEWMEEVEKARKKAEKLAKRSLNLEEQEVKYDALGNTIAVVEEKKELSRGDRKLLMKKRKEMVKNGEDTYEIDQQLGVE